MKLAIIGTRNPGVSYAEGEELLLSKANKTDVTMVVSGGHSFPIFHFPLHTPRH